MNFQPTIFSQTCAALRKDKSRRKTGLSLRCDLSAEPGAPISPRPLRELQHSELERRASQLLRASSDEVQSPHAAQAADEFYREGYEAETRMLAEGVKELLNEEDFDHEAFLRVKADSAEYLKAHKKLSGATRSYLELQSVVNALLRHHHQDQWDRAFSPVVRQTLAKRVDAAEAVLVHERFGGSPLIV